LLVLLEQLIAPRDGRVHCLLPFGQVAPAVDREQGIVRQPAQQMLGSEHLDPWGREFKRKREGVETLADPDDRGRSPELLLGGARNLPERPELGAEGSLSVNLHRP
jgi:hypothetical protein